MASSTSGLYTLNLSKVRALPLPVAPTGVQERTIDVVDTQFTRLDAAEASLERAQRNLERYRASVLQAAVEGRLVPTEAEVAREEGRDYEPGAVLLGRILKERRRRWEEAELAKMEAKGKTPKDDMWKAKYKEPVEPDVEGLPELPEGWCWASIDVCLWDAGYGTSQKCAYAADGAPVLRIPNIQHGTITVDDMKFAVSDERLRDDGILRPADFLFIRTNGSKNLIGRGALVAESLPTRYHFASYLIRLRLLPVNCLPQWVALSWSSHVLREQILADAASSAGQYNVRLSASIAYALPIPPSCEQRRILEKVEALLSMEEAAVGDVVSSLLRVGALRSSVLSSAFKGDLADQDPTDEPADVLLERIKAEVAERTITKSKPRKKTRRKKAKTQ